MDSTSPSLLERLSKGNDPVAWDRFVELYTPLLMSWCARLGLSEPDAADFAQDVFILALRHFPEFRYDPARSFRAWLKTVLMNVWRNHQRKAARTPAMDGNPDLIPATDPTRFVDEAEHCDFLVRRVMAVARVDFEPTTWKACWEFVVNDRPAADVAAELHISVNAVYLAKTRVLRHLRAELAGFLD